jgi:hypothetical protein
MSAIHPLLRSQWRLDRSGDVKLAESDRPAPYALAAETTIDRIDSSALQVRAHLESKMS